ncbi:leucine-rich PPR motif-containing protein, mitochondrial isoform X1 [Sphaeramia orbicularis]|uniref:leucine-rich PPR motif-containing protein, mitochondrial isoform X1 n=1 Tax=Sphaeramia orbicularis TaxID=375764 RepID=UPI00117CD75B|nr:leucine-rich PPR motif-containing protein, mitochondrial isoform X1 [Sphaeramia orbicularis]
MAALLRSARLLKFTPSGLLQITGTKRNGLPLSRLYSGTLGIRRTGVCSRHIGPAVENAPSRLSPYTVGCVRNYAVAREQKDEASSGVQSKQAQQFDSALSKLDNSVRRTGRITKTMLLRVFHDICRTGYPSGNQALLLLRSCGSLLPEVPPVDRTELAHHIWTKLQELGSQYDVSHYNAILKVYLQNEFKFSPTDFLAKMEAANILPNRVTYQRLIAAYCQNGDIEGASTILGFMKSKDLPITEAVFNALVTGHARAGDIDSSKNILTVMRNAGIEPGADTYVSLLTAFAEKGDIDGVKKALEEAENADCSLMDRDIMQVIFALAKAGHQQYVPEMVERLRHERSYIPDAMNLCLSLITHGQEDVAFQVLKNFPTLQMDNASAESYNLGNFFLRHCVNMNTALDKVANYCRDLQQSNLHTSPFNFTLLCALEAKNIGLSCGLMKQMKEQNLPVRPHFFWPLLIQLVKDNNTTGVVELVKTMEELGVAIDTPTLSNYILPAFGSLEEARQALKDAGVSVESEGFLISEIRSLAANDLAMLYTQLSDASLPSLDFSVFRARLIVGFRKSSDVESMVKITELLFKSERFHGQSTTSAERGGYFLYSLIDSMTEAEVQVQKDKLREYFKQLQALNITIPVNIYRGIRNLLDSYNVPELIKDVAELIDPKDKASAELSMTGPRATQVTEDKVETLENKLAELKAENKSIDLTLKQIIQALCAEENLQRALELKQQHEEHMTAGGYAILINHCCRNDNAEEALNLKREMSRKDSSVALDASKYIALMKVFANSGKVEEAVDILKEMKEKDVMLNDTHTTMLFHALSSAAAKGGPTIIRRLQDTVFALGLAKPSANLCSPLITAYLDSNDLSGALDAALECQKRYNHLPRIHDILVGLVQQGDTELLQKAMDVVSQERGEMTMLYDLFFAFLQTGRYREARKIIETPGLRARPGRLHWYAEKCIAHNQMETLEHMVDMTAKLFECDRDEMYSYMLRLCKETNNWKKADALWTKMQEENIIPRERTLRLLADILRSNGQEVPFEVPESWYEQAAAPQQVKSTPTPATSEDGPDYHIRVLALCKRGKAKEAYEMVKGADEKGLVFGPASYDHLIRALLAEGSMDDAMALKDIAGSHIPGFKMSDTATNLLIVTQSKKDLVTDAVQTLKSMLQVNHVPSQLAITRLVQALGRKGDVSGIEDVQKLMKGLSTPLNFSSMLFINNIALAHIKNDDLDSAVELLETLYTNPDNHSASMSFVFRKILENGNDKVLDKFSVMAERLANHFACYRPASDLFLQLLDMDKVEDAKFMLARCNAVAEQKDILLSFMAQKSQTPGQLGKIQSLLSLIPDFAEEDVVYSYLIKCHVVDRNLPAAEALMEQMQKEGVEVDELSLKRLAVLYRKEGQTVPFPEPPESFKFYADKLREKASKAPATAEE